MANLLAKKNSSARCLLPANMLESWPQVYRVKIMFAWLRRIVVFRQRWIGLNALYTGFHWESAFYREIPNPILSCRHFSFSMGAIKAQSSQPLSAITATHHAPADLCHQCCCALRLAKMITVAMCAVVGEEVEWRCAQHSCACPSYHNHPNGTLTSTSDVCLSNAAATVASYIHCSPFLL